LNPAEDPAWAVVAFQSAPDGLVVLDAMGVIVATNDRAEAILGQPGKSLGGKNLGAWLDQDRRKILDSLLAGVVKGPVELAIPQATARPPVTVEVVAHPTGDASQHLVLAIRDVTVRRQAEEAARTQARRQALVAGMSRHALGGMDIAQLMNDAVRLAVSDLGVEFGYLLELLPDGRALFRSSTGWTVEGVRVASEELMPGTPAGRVILEQAALIIKNLPTDNRFPAPSLARERGVVSSLTVPISGHARPLGVLAVHSAHTREFSEEDVGFVQSVADVVAAVMERTREDERQRELQLGRAEQMAALGQVAAGVAHELRNPLTSIKGLIQVNLREAASRGLPAEDLRIIEHELRRMEKTLQTFLDFARPPRPQQRRFDLAAVVERVRVLIAGRARRQKVALQLHRPDEPVWVRGDPDQLQQLFLNLVLNALDVMQRGGAVDVELRPPRDGQIEALVRDNGPGIAAHILPKVFETFVSSKETGLGLGLPVSRRIAEDHGGSLTAYNLPAGGACFALRMPAAD